MRADEQHQTTVKYFLMLNQFKAETVWYCIIRNKKRNQRYLFKCYFAIQLHCNIMESKTNNLLYENMAYQCLCLPLYVCYAYNINMR